jgi:hypothetical protein
MKKAEIAEAVMGKETIKKHRRLLQAKPASAPLASRMEWLQLRNPSALMPEEC